MYRNVQAPRLNTGRRRCRNSRQRWAAKQSGATRPAIYQLKGVWPQMEILVRAAKGATPAHTEHKDLVLPFDSHVRGFNPLEPEAQQQ